MVSSWTENQMYHPISHQHDQQESDDDVIQSVERFLHMQDKLFYQPGIHKLQNYGLSTQKITEIMENKKTELSQRWPHDAPYIWCPENFQESLSTPTAIFPQIFNGLFF